MANAEQSNLTTLTVTLLSAYVANNIIEHSAIPELIKSTHAALSIIDGPGSHAAEETEHKPAVGVRKSLSSPDRIISMIDGKPYQTLKRHLARHSLTPKEYRERYKLPSDYPMVAPSYSESRRIIAQQSGLGRRAVAAQTASADALLPEASAPKKAAAPKAPAKAKTRSTPAAAIEAEPAKPARKPRAARRVAPNPDAAAEPTPAPKPVSRKRTTKIAPAK